MKRVHGFLLRFIDLGLLLLMAFLVVAELNPTHEVAMPGRPGDNTTTEGLQHYRITFDEALRMEVQERPGGALLCRVLKPEDLLACLVKQRPGYYLVVPQGQASVQQLVLILDICESVALTCMITPD